MNLGVIHQDKHTHVWTKTIDGAEFGNALYENEIDAAMAFMSMVVNIRKYDTTGINITIEDVMESLERGRGMYAGYPGFILVLSKCDGGCNSPSWN